MPCSCRWSPLFPLNTLTFLSLLIVVQHAECLCPFFVYLCLSVSCWPTTIKPRHEDADPYQTHAVCAIIGDDQKAGNFEEQAIFHSACSNRPIGQYYPQMYKKPPLDASCMVRLVSLANRNDIATGKANIQTWLSWAELDLSLDSHGWNITCLFQWQWHFLFRAGLRLARPLAS